MGADEEGTLNRLKAHRRELVDPKIRGHHGRIVKATDDGMLVEIFERLNAVRCAVEIQRAMVDRNAGTTEDKRITFPIGVNLGNVIADAGKNIRLPVHAYALSARRRRHYQKSQSNCSSPGQAGATAHGFLCSWRVSSPRSVLRSRSGGNGPKEILGCIGSGVSSQERTTTPCQGG